MNFLMMRSIRKKNKISQLEIAEKLGINRATVSKYETGIIEPSFSQLRKIADILNVDFFELLGKTSAEAYQQGVDDATANEDYLNELLEEARRQDGYTDSEIELRLIKAFSQLNQIGQRTAVQRIEELLQIEMYRSSKEEECAPPEELPY